MTNSSVLVTGNTYPVKDSIKALGGRWDAAAKGWRVPAAKADQAQALVSGAPQSAPRAASSYARAPSRSRWSGCGYPGCRPGLCDQCDGEGRRDGR